MDIRLLPKSFCKNLEQNISHMKKFMETEDKPYKGFKDYEIAKIQRIVDYMKSDIDNSEQKKADFYRYFNEYNLRRSLDLDVTFPEMREFWDQCRHYATRRPQV